MKKKTDWSSVILVAMNIALLILCLVFVVISIRQLPTAKENLAKLTAQWENGESIQGTAEKTGKKHTVQGVRVQDIRLNYEVEGTAYSTSSQASTKDFKDLDGKDKDGKGELEIRYNPSDPANPVTELEIGVAKLRITSLKTRAWGLGFMLAVFAIAGIIFIVPSHFSGKPKKQKTASTQTTFYGKEIVDLRTSAEKDAERNAGKPLNKPLEGYAQEICSFFKKGLSWNELEPELRKIGEKMNDHDKQMYVAYRANYLCSEAYRNGNKNCGEFSLRYLEYAWDGLGGWMK